MDSDALRISLGLTIRARRESMGYSQDTFADAIGMHRAYYASIERGKRNLTLSTLVRVAQGLGIRPSKLLDQADK
ncbi:helix-turn-helix transcriptional regulator [Dyella sp. LX-66]|uniref:helix-turn-helix domain-containing protein n=1 Tax=unclassified Dyella TaxID=2634549 RepID=UPI001BE0E285|nr:MULTISPECIES: helix-turn-helix transcriptional regulator [unclassified Dyella]MBT2117796.1 helix-turn-helix transcriptional regulator [Dyella sp. LX-1]MBT2141311.1 helix-turn-helix transcriptional regulator [Dyella sp. LX-66]